VTDFPVISDTDWYTLYFSKGRFQEGEAVARYLRRAEPGFDDRPVFQVFRDTFAGRALARGLRETRAAMGMSSPVDVVLKGSKRLSSRKLRAMLEENPDAVVALWIEERDVPALAGLHGEGRPPLVFLSAPLIGDALADVPDAARDIVRLTHPTAFSDDKAQTRVAIERWLEIRKIPLTNYDVQAKMYFVGWNLAMQIKMMRDEFYRDYLLDITDMMRDQDYAVGTYERLSFGPGQRYASKGCYIARLSSGPVPVLEKASGWVIH
jgi:hypothetical protein